MTELGVLYGEEFGVFCGVLAFFAGVINDKALLLLSSQSKVELSQDEFYQDLKIQVI